jgi:hypothetical protein
MADVGERKPLSPPDRRAVAKLESGCGVRRSQTKETLCMIAFLDFIASSTGRNSFPIEVAWVFEDGRSRSALIKPAPNWRDWSAGAEAKHGISKETLRHKGVPIPQIADEMVDTLSGHELFASAPSWDGRLLRALLRAGGLFRRALTLRNSEEAFALAVRQVLGDDRPDSEIYAIVERVICESKALRRPVQHALGDARLELERWKAAKAAAARLANAALEDPHLSWRSWPSTR